MMNLWERLSYLHGGAVGDDLGGALHDGGGGEADADDGVGAQRLGLGYHAIGGDGAGLLHHLGVGLELAADDGLEPGADVLADVLGLDGAALDEPEGGEFAAGDGFGSDDQHGNRSF